MKILKLDSDLCITCGLRTHHGVSGHVFELIEYFYYFYFYHGVDTMILVPFPIEPKNFFECLDKYDFNPNEIETIKGRTIFNSDVQLIYCRNIIFTDGEIDNCKILSKNIIFLRCNSLKDLDRANLILQDNRLYNERTNSVHYVKKILLSKFKRIDCQSDSALIYGTTNCRSLSYDDLINIDKKYNFNRYILITNKIQDVPSNFELKLAPVQNLFSLFKTYIYTKLNYSDYPFDCSPRFPVECHYYNKDFILDSPLIRGLDVRLYDIQNNFDSLFLNKNDRIIDYLI